MGNTENWRAWGATAGWLIALGGHSMGAAQTPAPPGAAVRIAVPIPPAPVIQLPDKVEGLLDITYLERSGYRPLTLDIYRQKDAKTRRPLVVYVHGGGFAAGSGRMSTASIARVDGFSALIAARGYTVASVEYRLSAEAKYPAQLQDVKAAIRWLRANKGKYDIDPDRVAIFGDSVGGSLAALVGVTCDVREFQESIKAKATGGADLGKESDCVQAAIDWFGVTDMAQLDAMAQDTPGVKATLIHNSPDSTQSAVLGCSLGVTCSTEVVQRANPIRYIDERDRSTSFLIMHGAADPAVSYKQSRHLYDELRKKGVPARLELVPGVGHYFAGLTTDQANAIPKMTLDFLDQTIGGSRP